jgi:hypothetical protein
LRSRRGGRPGAGLLLISRDGRRGVQGEPGDPEARGLAGDGFSVRLVKPKSRTPGRPRAKFRIFHEIGIIF